MAASTDPTRNDGLLEDLDGDGKDDATGVQMPDDSRSAQDWSTQPGVTTHSPAAPPPSGNYGIYGPPPTDVSGATLISTEQPAPPTTPPSPPAAPPAPPPPVAPPGGERTVTVRVDHSATHGSLDGNQYTVGGGDTLGAIAAANHTTVGAILDANPGITNPNLIQVGQTVVIPGATMTDSQAHQVWDSTIAWNNAVAASKGIVSPSPTGGGTSGGATVGAAGSADGSSGSQYSSERMDIARAQVRSIAQAYGETWDQAKIDKLANEVLSGTGRSLSDIDTDVSYRVGRGGTNSAWHDPSKQEVVESANRGPLKIADDKTPSDAPFAQGPVGTIIPAHGDQPEMIVDTDGQLTRRSELDSVASAKIMEAAAGASPPPTDQPTPLPTLANPNNPNAAPLTVTGTLNGQPVVQTEQGAPGQFASHANEGRFDIVDSSTGLVSRSNLTQAQADAWNLQHASDATGAHYDVVASGAAPTPVGETQPYGATVAPIVPATPPPTPLPTPTPDPSPLPPGIQVPPPEHEYVGTSPQPGNGPAGFGPVGSYVEVNGKPGFIDYDGYPSVKVAGQEDYIKKLQSGQSGEVPGGGSAGGTSSPQDSMPFVAASTESKFGTRNTKYDTSNHYKP